MAAASKVIQQHVDDDAAMAKGAAALPGHALQRAGTAHQTAVSVQVPRSHKRLKENCLEEAQEMKEDFFYHWEVNDKNADDGKKQIFGASIDGAMVMLRNWGNAVVDVELVEATYDHYVFKATLIDLERGFTCPRLYRKHRSDPPGRYERQRWDDMEFSDGQSRAIRNAICAALPPWLEKQCVQAAFKAAQNGLDPKREREDLVRRAAAIGVSQEQLEKKMGKPVAKLEAADCISLRAMLRTVEEKHARAEELFAVAPRSEPKSDDGSKDGKPQAMDAPKPNDSLVTKYAKRLRCSFNIADLDEVAQIVKEAVEQDKLTEDEAKALREIYKEQRKSFQSASPSGAGAQRRESVAAREGDDDYVPDSEELARAQEARR